MSTKRTTDSIEGEEGEVTPYKVPSQAMGWRPGLDLTHALRFAAELEDEEIIRRVKLTERDDVGRAQALPLTDQREQ